MAAVKRLAPVEMALGDADLIHAEARARPVVAILTAKLSNEFFRLSPRDFVAWFRFQFRLPQIPHLGNADLTGVERCLGICSRRREVDLYGNHANSSCLATGAGRGGQTLRSHTLHRLHGRRGCMAVWYLVTGRKLPPPYCSMSSQLRNAAPCSPSRPPRISRQRLVSLQRATAKRALTRNVPATLLSTSLTSSCVPSSHSL